MIGHASLNLLKANLGRFSGGGRVGEPGQAQNCAGAFQGSACFTTVDIPLAKRGPWPTQSHSGLPAKVHDKGRRVHQTTIKLAGEGEVRATRSVISAVLKVGVSELHGPTGEGQCLRHTDQSSVHYLFSRGPPGPGLYPVHSRVSWVWHGAHPTVLVWTASACESVKLRMEE